MKSIKSIILNFFVFLMILMLSNVSFATSTATYYSNGNPSSITNEKGTIRYYESGNVSSITSDGGTVSYNEDGTIISIVGTPAISLDEAKAEFENLKKQPTNTNTVTNTTQQVTESMPSTGIENNIFIFIAIAIIGVIFATFKYISLRKEFK